MYMDDIHVHIFIQGCAKAFITNCDKDADTYITEQEWGFCLGANTHCKLVLSSIVSLHFIDTRSKIMLAYISQANFQPLFCHLMNFSMNMIWKLVLVMCKGCDCIAKYIWYVISSTDELYL